MRRLIYLCLATCIVAVTVTGQTVSTNQQPDDRVVVGTNLVTVNVIVTDGKGHYVTGLSEDQFTIYDDKIKQQIAHFFDTIYDYQRIVLELQFAGFYFKEVKAVIDNG